jgi:linoleate 10R-lipoxygenase
MTKLLFRHLPDYYPAGSAYAHFPMMVPEKMRDFARDYPDDVWRKYTWDRPSVPAGPTVVVKSYSEVQKVFSQPTIYTSGSRQRLGILTGGVQLDFITSVRPPLHKSSFHSIHVSSKVDRVLTNDQELENTAQTFSNLMDKLIERKKLTGVGAHTNYIDIVRDVINLVPVYWLSNDIVCICYSAKLHYLQSCLRLGSL